MRSTLAFSLFLAFFLVASIPDAGAISYDQLEAEMKAKSDAYKKKMKDMTMRQTMTMTEDGQEMQTKMTAYSKGKKSRIESEMNIPDMGPMKSIVINDGENQWVHSDMTGGWTKAPKEDDGTVGPGDWWGGERRKGKVLGQETVAGREGWKVLFQDKGEKELVWIDTKELCPLKTVNQSDGTETRFSDFRTEAGFLWPHRMEMYQGGKKKGVMVIESMKINSGLKDSLFTVPKDAGSKQPNLQEMMKRFQQQGR